MDTPLINVVGSGTTVGQLNTGYGTHPQSHSLDHVDRGLCTLRLVELEALCRKHMISTTGRKADLIIRIREQLRIRQR